MRGHTCTLLAPLQLSSISNSQPLATWQLENWMLSSLVKLWRKRRGDVSSAAYSKSSMSMRSYVGALHD